MATLITGPDPTAPAWPIPLVPTKALTRPAGYSTTGGTEAAVIASLSDNNDATYIQQQFANVYWRYQVASYTLPFGARVVSVTPTVRARMVSSNVRNDWLVFQGDHSGVKYVIADHIPAVHYPMSSAPVRAWNGVAVKSLANGQAITQADLERGLYITFGLNTSYGSSTANATVRVTEAKLNLTYDLAPTATLTGIATGGTINDTASPLLTWDYSDDFQAQAAYRVVVKNSSNVVVYDSGKASGSDTSHQIQRNLPNDTYSVSLTVWQNWSGPGGAFPSLSPATGTFTVNVLKLGVPRLSAAVDTTKAQTKVTVTPDINLLNYDDSTFDRGVLTLQNNNTNCTIAAATTPVLNGTGSGKVTVTAAGTAVVTSRVGCVACNPLEQHNLLIYVNPLALAGRSAQLKVSYRNAAGGIISTVSGSVTALTASTWNALTIVNATAPLLAASLDWSVTFTGTSAADVLYLDNAAVWHGGSGTRTNLNQYPNFENNATTGYLAAGNNAPTIAVINTDAYLGTRCLKVTSTGTNIFFPGVTQQAITTVVGAKYSASAYVKLPTAGAVSQVYGIVNGTGYFTNVATDKDVWTRVSVTFVANSTSTSISWAFGGSDLATGQYFYIDALLFEQSDTVLSYFDGSSPAAAWTGTVYASTSTITTTFPLWSRGGFYETTPNVLTYDDSTLEGDSWVWAPTPDSNTTVTVGAAQAVHGSRSLVVSRTVASTSVNYAAATVGVNSRYPCTAGETIRGFFAARAGSTGRTVSLNLDFYDANGATAPMPGGASNAVVQTADVSTGWVTASGSIVAPPNAVGFRVSVLALTAIGVAFPINELHYFDAISVYRSAYDIGYTPGYLPSTDEAPTVVVEYSDGGGTWYELGRLLSAQSDLTEVFYDYTVRSGITRSYRAYLTETENSTQLTSDYTSLATADLTLTGAWLATMSDPVNTSHQFRYDGAGRSANTSALPQTIQLDGRSYPFAEFGNSFDQSLQVTLQLASDSDNYALLALANAKDEVIFRDQRGRAIRGVMGTVGFNDEIWGTTASFTLQASGVQP